MSQSRPAYNRNVDATVHRSSTLHCEKSARTPLGAAFFSNSTSLLTNNVFREQPCIGPVDVVRFEDASPTLHNNTIQFSTCSGCDIKRGLFVNGSSLASVRNNIFLNAGTATGAPAFDFDGDPRPQEMSYDIGADEYVP